MPGTREGMGQDSADIGFSLNLFYGLSRAMLSNFAGATEAR